MIPQAAAVNRLLAALKRCPQGATLDGLKLGGHNLNTINYAVAMSLIEVRHERVNDVGCMERYFAKQWSGQLEITHTTQEINWS